MLTSENFQKNNERKVFTTESLEDFEKIKEENKDYKIICVHSGTFHGDEVLATLLLKFHPSYPKTIVIRSRNEKIFEKCDIVCDVGGKFSPENLRFDHHMKEFTEVYASEDKYKGMKLSSAGLIFKYLGKDIIINILKDKNLFEQNKSHIEEILKKVYNTFILSVDAKDNGINQYETVLEPKYEDDTSYEKRVGRLNPEWNVKDCDVNKRFQQSWDIAEEELYYHLMRYANSYFLAYDKVYEAVQIALKSNTHYIVMEQYLPWLGCLTDIEEKLELDKTAILFGISPTENGKWSCRTIAIKKGSFEFKKGLPVNWRGKRDKELQEISGIGDAVFVHATGFIGFFGSKESAIKCAECSILAN